MTNYLKARQLLSEPKYQDVLTEFGGADYVLRHWAGYVDEVDFSRAKNLNYLLSASMDWAQTDLGFEYWRRLYFALNDVE